MNPPPEEQHKGLRRWVRGRMHKSAICLTEEQRALVGKVIVREMLRRGARLIALAVLGEHVHGLAKMRVQDRPKIVGQAKARSSHRIREQIPGAVWGRRADFRVVVREEYQRKAFSYVVKHWEEGAWVWTFRDAVPEA